MMNKLATTIEAIVEGVIFAAMLAIIIALSSILMMDEYEQEHAYDATEGFTMEQTR